MSLPDARLAPERRFSLAWIVPVIALALAGWIVFASWRERGERIEVLFPEGHGLEIGDTARCRGIVVGEVIDIALAGDMEAVLVTVSLERASARLARSGTRFWVVRPRVRLSGIDGADTILGARYIAMVPGRGGEGGGAQREFIGLAEPPVVESIDLGDLEVVLDAPRRDGLSAGAPVTFREVRVGTVLSVALSSDGRAVEARVHIEKAYRGLVRAGTRFWSAGGLKASVGLGGVSVEVDSIEQLVVGGVALATPPADDAGDAVRTGHRFVLHAEPDDEWLEWAPMVAVGSALLPAGASMPRPLRAMIEWRQGLIVKNTRSRGGWLLQTTDGLVGPADLLAPDLSKRADRETLSLEVAGRLVALDAGPKWQRQGLACLDVEVTAAAWPSGAVRAAAGPEDCLAVADASAAPMPLATARLTADGEHGWRVDVALPLDETWHGACVMSREDGKLVGMLLVTDDGARVATFAAR